MSNFISNANSACTQRKTALNKAGNLLSWLSLSVLTIALTSCFSKVKAHKSATGKNKIASTLPAESLTPTLPKSTPSGLGTSAVQEQLHSAVAEKEQGYSPVQVTHRETLTCSKSNYQPAMPLPTEPLSQEPVVLNQQEIQETREVLHNINLVDTHLCFNGISCYICGHTFTKEEDAAIQITALSDYELLVHKKDCLEALIKREQELTMATGVNKLNNLPAPTPDQPNPSIDGVLQLLTDQGIETTCPICMEDFTQADQVLCKLGDPCTCKTHVYHTDCISSVITTNPNHPSCPFCNQHIETTKIINILNKQKVNLTIAKKPNNVLPDIETKIQALQSRFGNQCVKVEYLNHLSTTPAFSLDQKEKMFEYLDKEIDQYDDPTFFNDLIINLITAGEITKVHKHRDFWNWMNRLSSS